MFLVCIIVLHYIVNIDANSQMSKMFQTFEFSVIITNLPEITKSYSVEQLKLDLWDHIENAVRSQK